MNLDRRCAALAAALCASQTWADTINVEPGESIQDAIDLASGGDLVLVAPGTYVELIDFLGKAIVVQSAGGAAVTIIDGAHAGSVVTCANGETAKTVLEGFTVTGGAGTPIQSVPGPPPAIQGGGLYCAPGSFVTVVDCTFKDNVIGATGFNADGAGFLGAGNLIGCTFTGNRCLVSLGSWGDNDGGGALVRAGSSVTRCTFIDNTARYGGALNVDSVPVTACRFLENRSLANFSTVYCWSGSQFTNCEFIGNNSVCFDGTSPGLVNCTFWHNYQLSYGPLPSMTNCIVDGDPLFVDPLGADGIEGTLDDDLRLRFGSPYIDAGDTRAYTGPDTDLGGAPRIVDELLVPDVAGPIDMGAHEYQPCRSAGGEADGDVDFRDLADVLVSWGPCAGCPWDVNGDGEVSFFDLLYVLLYWGDC